MEFTLCNRAIVITVKYDWTYIIWTLEFSMKVTLDHFIILHLIILLRSQAWYLYLQGLAKYLSCT